MANRVDCINKDDRYSTYERIQNLGGVRSDGARWKSTQQQVIGYIEQGYSFYVDVQGNRVNLEIAISPQGNKYVKTENDGAEPNNLLSLPECR